MSTLDINTCAHGNKLTWTKHKDGYYHGFAKTCRICKDTNWKPTPYKPADPITTPANVDAESMAT